MIQEQMYRISQIYLVVEVGGMKKDHYHQQALLGLFIPSITSWLAALAALVVEFNSAEVVELYSAEAGGGAH